MSKTLLCGSLISLLCGCGGLGALGGGYAACDFRQGSVTSKENRCQERYGLSASTFLATCRGLGAGASDGRCPSANVVGGCNIGTQGDGTSVIDWYYAPSTVADAKKECGTMTFLDAYK